MLQLKFSFSINFHFAFLEDTCILTFCVLKPDKIWVKTLNHFFPLNARYQLCYLNSAPMSLFFLIIFSDFLRCSQLLESFNNYQVHILFIRTPCGILCLDRVGSFITNSSPSTLRFLTVLCSVVIQSKQKQ